jgi:hypothetical protein
MIMVSGGLGFIGSPALALLDFPRWHSPCARTLGEPRQKRRKDWMSEFTVTRT